MVSMIQRLITVGNSKAFVITKDILKQVGNDDMVHTQFLPKRKRIIIDFDQQEIVDSVVDPEVYAVAKNLLKRYKVAFTELAKK